MRESTSIVLCGIGLKYSIQKNTHITLNATFMSQNVHQHQVINNTENCLHSAQSILHFSTNENSYTHIMLMGTGVIN